MSGEPRWQDGGGDGGCGEMILALMFLGLLFFSLASLVAGVPLQ